MDDQITPETAFPQNVAPQAEQPDKAAQSDNLPCLRLLTLDDLENLPPLEWLIEGHISKNALCEIYGATGDGKSFIALDMACSVATGTNWLNWKTEQGAVIYVAAEGVDGVRKRVKAWRNSHAGDPKPNLHFFDDGLQLGEGDSVERVINTANKLPVRPSLIILDTRARCTVGTDENSAKEMGVFVEGCEKIRKATGSTVLIVHHSGKNGDSRGSTTVKAACDTHLKAVKVKNTKIKITCEKQKNFAPFEDITVEFVPDAPSDSCFLQSCDDDGANNSNGLTRQNGLTGQKRILLNRITEAMTNEGMTLSDIEALNAVNVKQRSLIEKLNELIEAGYLVKLRVGQYMRYFLPEQTPLTLND